MKIVVNGRFMTRRMTGVDRFALELLSGLDRLMARKEPEFGDLEVKLLVPPGTVGGKQFSRVQVEAVGRGAGQWWEQVHLPRFVEKGSLLLSLCNTGPAFCKHQAVVIHDAATARMPEAFSKSFRWWYGLLMPLLGKRVRRVLTVSKFSQSEIEEVFSIPREKTSVVTEGGEHILRVHSAKECLVRFGLGGRPFVLAVSSMAAHKNFRLVLDAVAKFPNAPFDVAIAGGANKKIFGDAGHLGSDRVLWLGYVSDEELRALYESAMCFVFPSLYEGFGIPPLEAMHCGCPVLAASAASIPEVCGDAALYFDPKNASELAALLSRVVDDPMLLTELSERGRRRATSFSWELAARQLIEACRERYEAEV